MLYNKEEQSYALSADRRDVTVQRKRESLFFPRKYDGGHRRHGAFGALSRNCEDCVRAVRFLKREGVPYVLLGNGSNVLVSDKGFDGAVICTRRMKTIRVDACGVYAESGAALDAVVLAAAECGWGGLSFLCGIPATLGALCL